MLRDVPPPSSNGKWRSFGDLLLKHDDSYWEQGASKSIDYRITSFSQYYKNTLPGKSFKTPSFCFQFGLCMPKAFWKLTFEYFPGWLFTESSHPKLRNLVGGWTNPFEKYARQNGFIFPKVRGKNKKCLKLWNHHLGNNFIAYINNKSPGPKFWSLQGPPKLRRPGITGPQKYTDQTPNLRSV